MFNEKKERKKERMNERKNHVTLSPTVGAKSAGNWHFSFGNYRDFRKRWCCIIKYDRLFKYAKINYTTVLVFLMSSLGGRSFSLIPFRAEIILAC